MKLSDSVIPLLRCPSCGSRLASHATELACERVSCGSRYPVVDEVPVLVGTHWHEIPPDRYLAAMTKPGSGFSVTAFVRSLTPSVFRREKTKSIMHQLRALLKEKVHGNKPVILVIAGSQQAPEASLLRATEWGEVVVTGVVPGLNESDILCELCALPFQDAVFDAVVIHGALHRTFDVSKAVHEVLRVVRQDSYVYAEEPFMEPITNGPYDFYRFSHLGLRGQFAGCEELDSGVVDGTGTALASLWRQFLSSWARGRRMSFLLATFGSFSSFFLKYFDTIMEKRPHVFNAPSSVYFLGKPGGAGLSLPELVAGYRGVKPYTRDNVAERPANLVFTEWAARDRDLVMQNNHAAPVKEMLAAAFEVLDTTRGFTAIDAGCGNGWIVRLLRQSAGCLMAAGVDVSAGMIAKARSLDPHGQYFNADLAKWEPPGRVDLVVSMEVLYYLEDPLALLQQIASRWLQPGGYAVFGIDHYQENESSLGWPVNLGVHMTTWPEEKWLSTMDEAGFTRVRTWHSGPRAGWLGTLVMLVRAPGGG